MYALDFFLKSVKEQLNKEYLSVDDYFAIRNLVRFVEKVGLDYKLEDGVFYFME